MADSSLDDFFAKKDKSKKGKSKIKYTTSESIAKNLEGGKRPDLIIKKDTKEKIPGSTIQSISIPTSTTELDDEWNKFEEEERDYSGLRVQALSISEKEKEEELLKEQTLSEQNGDSSKNSEVQGPWKSVQGTPITFFPKEEVEKEKPPEEPQPAKEEVKATYRPPALRNASSMSSSASSKRHGKNAPQLSSDADFPTLSAAESNKGKSSELDKSFQSVKHGVRMKNDTHKDIQLDLGNKYSALPQGD